MFLQLKSLLENIDRYRDRLLFPFIEKHWPRFILPNHLSALRIIMAFFIIYLLLSGFTNGLWLMLIFVFASLLDLFDGSVARALNEKSKLGAVLDTFADKILVLPIAIFVLANTHFLLLVMLILPEIISGVMLIYFNSVKRVLKPTIFGKTKMVIECVAFAIIILFDFPGAPSVFPIILLYAAVLFAFLNILLNSLFPPPYLKDVETI